MKWFFYTFLLYIVFEVFGAICIMENKPAPNIVALLIYILQIVIILKIYFMMVKEDKKTYYRGKMWNNIILSLVVFICWNISERGFVLFFMPDYSQNINLNLVTVFEICIVAPICEEVIFRGALLTQLSKKYSFLVANIIQAGIFAILHLDIWIIIILFFFGMIMGIVNRTKGIYCCIFIHMLNNILSTIMQYQKIEWEFPRVIYLGMFLLFAVFTIIILVIIDRWRSSSLRQKTEPRDMNLQSGN